MNTKRYKVLKVVILAVFIIFLAYLTIKMFPMFKELATEQGRENFKNQIQNSGISGAMYIIGLMLLQILLAFLPGEPIEILAGICYGPIWGTLTIFIGALLSSSLIFFTVRKLGRNFIYTFVDEEKIKKIENSKFLKNENRIELIMLMLFLVPGTPKDLFVYIGALLPVNPVAFLVIATFARFPSVVSSTLAGSSIMDGNWINVIIIYAITFSISGIIILIYNYINKKPLKP